METIRPRVSRETRLLLAIVLISLSMLWVLARIRFPARPATPNPVPPVLAQLTPPSAFEDIATSVAQLQPRLDPSLVAIAVQPPRTDGSRLTAQRIVPALRLRDDLAVAILQPVEAATAAGGAAAGPGLDVVGHDPASKLAVVRVGGEPVTSLSVWSPRRPEYPRFLIAAEVLGDAISLRPVFVGSLSAATSPLWPGPIWAMPERTEVAAGTFAFTVDGELVGVVIERDEGPAIVPGDLVVTAANRLLEEGPRLPGQLGIHAAPLTAQLAAATGAAAGVIVTFVDPQGPAGGQLTIADVVEEINGEGITTIKQWDARVARLAVGEPVVLKARGRGGVRDVKLTAASPAPPEAAAERPLGLTMRPIRQVGAEILRIDAGSAAARAGLRLGDIITVVGDLDAPTPSQVLRSFASAPTDRPLVVAITRGEDHHVFGVEKHW